jgi:hypothetical protein
MGSQAGLPPDELPCGYLPNLRLIGEALNACKDEASATKAAITSKLKTILMVRPNRNTK